MQRSKVQGEFKLETSFPIGCDDLRWPICLSVCIEWTAIWVNKQWAWKILPFALLSKKNNMWRREDWLSTIIILLLWFLTMGHNNWHKETVEGSDTAWKRKPSCAHSSVQPDERNWPWNPLNYTETNDKDDEEREFSRHSEFWLQLREDPTRQSFDCALGGNKIGFILVTYLVGIHHQCYKL